MKNNAYDVIIIGGGVIGCAAAYNIAKNNIKVLVLEEKEIGHGGSSRNGGGVRQSARDIRELPLAMYAIENQWENLKEELGVDVEYYKKGNLRLGKTEEHLKKLEQLAQKSISAGLDVKMISGDEAREICPYMSKEVLGASWCPTDGHANPMLTTLGYYKRAMELGALFATGEKVIGLKKYKGKIRYVLTEKNTYEAETVIVAGGYESRDIINSVGIDIPMKKELLEALVTEAQPKMFEQMLGTAEADFYGHQTTHGSFVFGGSCGMEAFDAEVQRSTTTSITASYICRGVIKYFPILQNAKIVRTWAGWIDVCQDDVPVISTVSEVAGLIIACGFTGHGFGISPAVGLTLSEMVMQKKTTVNVDALRYDRFKAKA